jgi:hypothetical protein
MKFSITEQDKGDFEFLNLNISTLKSRNSYTKISKFRLTPLIYTC